MTASNKTFPLGRTVATRGVIGLGVHLIPYLDRHAAGDWGVVCDDDARANDDALTHGERLVSAYETPAGRIFIITEWDRSVTTVLLPEEY